MRFTRLRLQNWRNFPSADVRLGSRLFVFGPNASGKSNWLDAFRFLRDVAREEGGLKRAVNGLRKEFAAIRSLHAHGRNMDVLLEAHVLLEENQPEWTYLLVLGQDSQKRVIVKREEVRQGARQVLARPNDADKRDPEQKAQTHLEQLNANADFRDLAKALASVEYIHLVPQLLRSPDRYTGDPGDPFGADFLERVARTSERKRKSRLQAINKALKAALPQFEDLQFERDEVGRPHLKARYLHWRPKGNWQQEDQFSDGTLRLFGLLWELAEPGPVLLLEEPELSLHSGIVRQIPRIMARVAGRSKQILVSSHSEDLLADGGVDPSEILVLTATDAGTEARLASTSPEVNAVAAAAGDIGPLIVSLTKPKQVEQLALFKGA
jgi:predicted ATPase